MSGKKVTAVFAYDFSVRDVKVFKLLYTAAACTALYVRHKALGAGGKTLKKIGTLARQECEKMLECKVYLELWVKVKEDWRNSENLIKELGIGDMN